MKLDLKQLDEYDLIEEISAETVDEPAAKFYFRGTRDWFWDLTSNLTDGQLKLSFEMQYKFLVGMMVKWENLFDAERNLAIPFSKDRALNIIQTFEIIPQDRMMELIIKVWNKVAGREEFLKNFLEGQTNTVASGPGGLTSASTTVMTQSGLADSAKKKRVKKS